MDNFAAEVSASRFDNLFAALNGLAVRRGVPMSGYTSFRIGGDAALMVEPRDAGELIFALRASREAGVPAIVIGNGTNLLVRSRGVDALMIRIGESMGAVTVDGCRVTAGAGALLSAVARDSVASGLMGLEWAGGIPGSVGGAVAMNAGAYGGEMKDVLEWVEFVEDGELKRRVPEPGDMGYRYSAFADPRRAVVRASFLLEPDDGGAAGRAAEYTRRRQEKQPLRYPSAGSVFKRPAGFFAGKLIEDAGLKGVRVGGAEVSELHAGFIINRGGAVAEDVEKLIALVQERVFDTSGVLLEPEIRIIGKEADWECIY